MWGSDMSNLHLAIYRLAYKEPPLVLDSWNLSKTYLCWWIISTGGHYPPSNLCFHTVYKTCLFRKFTVP